MLPRSLAGDGISTVISGFLGGPPTNTTYAGEHRRHERHARLLCRSSKRVTLPGLHWLLALQACGAHPFHSSPVMGGVSLLLFGLIASNGLRMFVTNKVDLAPTLMIASVVIIWALAWKPQLSPYPIGQWHALRHGNLTLVGIIMNLVLPMPPAKKLCSFGSNPDGPTAPQS